jgi:hypothetical protein
MSTRFHGKVFTFEQPDGAQIQLRGFGDQNYAVSLLPASAQTADLAAQDVGNLNSWPLEIRPQRAALGVEKTS